jgi:predicted aconitase with swiveling domain
MDNSAKVARLNHALTIPMDNNAKAARLNHALTILMDNNDQRGTSRSKGRVILPHSNASITGSSVLVEQALSHNAQATTLISRVKGRVIHHSDQ